MTPVAHTPYWSLPDHMHPYAEPVDTTPRAVVIDSPTALAASLAAEELTHANTTDGGNYR